MKTLNPSALDNEKALDFLINAMGYSQGEIDTFVAGTVQRVADLLSGKSGGHVTLPPTKDDTTSVCYKIRC